MVWKGIVRVTFESEKIYSLPGATLKGSSISEYSRKTV